MERIKAKTKSLLKFSPLFLALFISIIFYFYSDTQYLIDAVGVENAYLLMFFFAMFAGLMTFNTVPYYSLLVLLASSGLDPFWLGLSSAFGVMFGDTFSYLLGRNGSGVIPTKIKWFFQILQNLAEHRPNMFLLTSFLYGALSPLSNDLLTIPAGIAKISYWRLMLPLAAGNIVFNLALAYLSANGSAFIAYFY